MKTIICLGNKACDIGEKFEDNKSFIVKLIDVDIEGDNCYALKKQNSPEEYEKNTPDFKSFFNNVTDDIVFMTSGDSEVLSCSLKLLQQIKHKNITVVYLHPELDFLPKLGTLQNRIAFKVLQEYTRSGLLKDIILIDEKITESVLGDVPLSEVYDSFINLIYNSLESLSILENLEPVISSVNKPSDVSRICTIGYYDLEEDTEKLFFDLKFIDNKCYNFFIKEQSLKTDNTLYKSIKQKIKSKLNEDIKLSYTVHSTKNEKNYCYIKAYSKIIQ